MLEIRNYSFSFKLTFSNPFFFFSFNLKHQKCISKINKALQNYGSKPLQKNLLQHLLYNIKNEI